MAWAGVGLKLRHNHALQRTPPLHGDSSRAIARSAPLSADVRRMKKLAVVIGSLVLVGAIATVAMYGYLR